MTKRLTAAICLIGDELLSGRTRDINAQTIARFLAPFGIPVAEVRIVPDDQARIIEAVNQLRAAYTYVFTTGGIGPTHDDITADAIAAAFGVGISEHPEALAILSERYAAIDTEFTPARRRMARVPDGARLISNPVSGAPGFQTGNVFTLAGVPKIAEAMLQDIEQYLEHGEVVKSVTIRGDGLREGDLADALVQLSDKFPQVSIGSYPWFRSINDHGVALLARATDAAIIETIATELEAIVRSHGRVPERVFDTPDFKANSPRPGVD